MSKQINDPAYREYFIKQAQKIEDTKIRFGFYRWMIKIHYAK